MTTRRMWLDLPHAEPVTAVAFREEDRVLYTNGADGVASRWRVPGPVLSTEGREINTVAFHPDRQLPTDGGIDIRLWDVTSQDHPVPVGPPLAVPPDSDRLTGSIALSPDGATLAAATRAVNSILHWDVTDAGHARQLPVLLPGHTALIESVRFSHDGQLLASTSDDGTIRLWNTTDVREPIAVGSFDFEVGFVYATTFSPNGDLLPP